MRITREAARHMGADKNIFAVYAWTETAATREFFTTYSEASESVINIQKYDANNGTKTHFRVINNGEIWLTDETRHY